MAKNSLCYTTGGPNPFADAPRGSQLIELRQQGRDRFTVRYGLRLHERLTYDEAARELGAAIMHMQACAGLIDNRERDER